MPSSSSAADLTQQFQQAADRVSNLPPQQAADGMKTLYGLYKQATDGDHDTFRGEVGREDHDNPDGPTGLSQAQWDSWSQFKGVSQSEAMRRYIAEAAKLSPAPGAHGKGDGDGPAPLDPTDPAALAHTEAAAANHGLRGNLRAGTPYGSEETLKAEADAPAVAASPAAPTAP